MLYCRHELLLYISKSTLYAKLPWGPVCELRQLMHVQVNASVNI